MKLASIVIAVTGGLLFAISGVIADYRSSWYRNLRKPSWLTFEGFIPIIWAAIFVASTLSAVFTWNRVRRTEAKMPIFSLLGLNATLNLLYIVFFTRQRDVARALVDNVGIVATISGVMLLQWRYSKLAALLNLPYLLWSSIAAYITWFILAENRPKSQVFGDKSKPQ